MKNRESGQIMIAILISMVLFVGGTLMWGYMQQLQMKTAAIRSGMDVNAIASTVAGRARNLLARNIVGCPDWTAFRDYSPQPDPPPPQPTVTYNPNATWGGTPPSDGTPSAIACLLTQQEADTLSSFRITITRIGQPNIVALTSRVRVEITAKTKQAAGASIITSRVTRNYNLRVAKLNFFNLVIIPAGFGAAQPAPPYVEVENPVAGGSIEVTGSSFYGGTTPVKLSEITKLADASYNPAVFFNRPFYYRPSTFVDEGVEPFDVNQIKRTFRGGVEANTLSSVSRLPLPFEDATSAAPWSQDFDYAFQYGSAPGSPLPRMDYLSTVFGGGGPYSSWVDNPPTKGFNGARADVTILPSPAKGIAQLQDTCSSTMDPIPSFVFMRQNQTLTIDFTGTSATIRPIFCGLVMANQLTIITPGPGKYALFGTFIVNKLYLRGPGQVYFYNPAESQPPEVSLPPGQNQFNMFNQFLLISNQAAHNFYVPVFLNPAILPPPPPPLTSYSDYLPQMPDEGNGNGWFEPCSGAVNNPQRCIKQNLPVIDYGILYPSAANYFAYVVEDAT